MSGTHNVFRVFVKVPRAKIAEYRRAKTDQNSADNAIAREISQPLALTRPFLTQLHEYSLGVYYSDALPAELEEGGLFFNKTA